MKVKREAACLCVCELRFFYTSCAAPLPTHCPPAHSPVGLSPTALAYLFFNFADEAQRRRENIQTQLFHVHNAFHVGCRRSCCCPDMCASHADKQQTPPTRLSPNPNPPLPPSLACLCQLTSLCPAQPRNEKLNCVTRSKRVATPVLGFWPGLASSGMG